MKNQNKRLSSKRYIRSTLITLMSDKSYDEITVKDICNKANLSRMTFYRYYTNKDDIFREYTDERFADFYNILVNEKDVTLDKFCFMMFDYLKKYQKQIEILRVANKEFLLLYQFRNYASYLLKKFDLVKTYKKITTEVVQFVAGGIYSLLLSWLDSKMSQTPEQMAEILKRFITNPLFE